MKTFEFTKNDPEKIKSLIISLLVEQFLKSTYTCHAEDITGKDIIDVTFMNNFPKCNICRSFNCEHIDMTLNDKDILSDLKKDGIRPVLFDLNKFLENVSDPAKEEINPKNKFKIRD